MSKNPGNNPFSVFLDLNGRPLNGGSVYIGIAGMDPQTNPQQVWWDDAGTIPAVQPLETLSGYVVNSGAVARFWTENNSFSIRVRDRQGVEVFYAADVSFPLPDGSVTHDALAAGAVDAPKITSDITKLNAITDKLQFIHAGVGPVSRSLASKNSDIVSIKDFGAKVDGAVSYGPYITTGTDDTAAVQAAIDWAFANNKPAVFVPAGRCVIYGTLYMKPGVTLYGNNPVGPYWGTRQGVAEGGTLVRPDKPEAATGPIIEMCSSAGLLNLNVRCDKIGGQTGVVRMGTMDPTDIVVYASIINCHISGVRTGDLSGVTTSRGIFFPGSNSGYARYFNRVSNVTVTECDIAIGLQQQANANNFSNIITRECHRHYELNGTGSECIENTFTGLTLMSINMALSPDPVGFVLQENVKNNSFISYSTEMGGYAYDIHPTAIGNRFLGQTNEAVASYVPAETNADFNYANAVNVAQLSEKRLPTRTTGDRYIFGGGTRFERIANVAGTLPQCNNNAGTLVAGDADNRIIMRFNPAAFAKGPYINMNCHLRIYADAPASSGTSVADIHFMYRTTDSATQAGQLSVISTSNKGSHISGVWFISSKSSPGNGFAIALVGGTYGATAFDSVRVTMECDVMLNNGDVTLFSNLSDVTFATEAVTANDVADGINLLTVADTAV